MDEIINEIQNLDYVNIPLFKKMKKNIDSNIKRSIEKSDFGKAAKLKFFKLLLGKYIKECRYIDNEIYLKNILKKIQDLSIKISKITHIENNDTLIDIHIPKFNNEYINLLFIFIYEFCKTNDKALRLIATDYIKKLYYIIQNSSLDNIYSKVSLYDFIINNPNKKLEIFTKKIKEKELKNDLISYSIELLYPLYKKNNIVNIKDINKLKLVINKTVTEQESQKNIELKILEEKLFGGNDIDIKEKENNFNVYKSILKVFIKNYPRFSLKNYKEYITEYIEKILNYNVNNIVYILNCNMRFKYSINKKKIIMLIDIDKDNKTYVYDNLYKLIEKINNTDLNKNLSKYNIKLDNKTIITLKLIILIFIIDIFKNNNNRLIEKKTDTFINYIKESNKKDILLYNINNVLNHIKNSLTESEKEYLYIQKFDSYNIKFISKKTVRNPLDLDPDGSLFNNKISYFNECKYIIRKFIKKIPNIFVLENNLLKLEEFINFYIISETITLRKKIAVIETKNLEKIIKLNFSSNQKYIYNILLNNFFSNNESIKYNINNNNDNNDKINIYIYRSKHYTVNILIIFLIFLFKQNKKDICKNIISLLEYFKDKLEKKLNITKYYIGCNYIKKNVKLETLCLNNYNIINNKFNLVEISKYLLNIIDNNKFKIIYSKKTDNFDFTIDYNDKIEKITEHLTNSQFLKGINDDLNFFIKKDINRKIINIFIEFINEITNIFINIFTESKFIFNILNIQINDSEKKNIFQYLNHEEYNIEESIEDKSNTDEKDNNEKKSNIYYKLNLKIRKLCVIIFIKVFIKYILVQFKNGLNKDYIFTDIINKIGDIIYNKIHIEYRYNEKKILEDFINKYSYIFSKD